MDDITLGPLLNAAALASDGIEQLIHSPTAAMPSGAAQSGASSKKKAAKKKPSIFNYNISNFLNHSDSDAHKLQTNQLLLETASRIEDAISELEEYADILSADGSILQHRKDNSRSAAANNIRSSIVPLLQITANTLREAGRCFAPYSGTDRLQYRNDVDRRRRLTNQNDNIINVDAENNNNVKIKSSELMMIDDFVKRSNWSPPEGTSKNASSSSSSKKKRKAVTTSLIPTTCSVTILKPQNGSLYTKSEAIAMMKQRRKGHRRPIVDAMIQKGFVPVGKRALERLMKKAEDGEVMMDVGWSTGGRPSTKHLVDVEIEPIDCNLTFDDLDTGDNRIVVEFVKEKKQKTDGDDDEGEEEEGDGEGGANAASAESATKQPHEASSPSEQDQKPRAIPRRRAKSKPRPLSAKSAAKAAAFELPPPRDGSNEYTKSEFVEVAKSFMPSNQHHLAIHAMMQRGYVGKLTKRTLERYLERGCSGETIIDTPWTSGRTGRPPKVTFDEINEIVDKIKQEDLRIYEAEDVKELLVEAAMKRGEVDEAKLFFSERTTKDYFTILKSKLSPLYWKRSGEA